MEFPRGLSVKPLRTALFLGQVEPEAVLLGGRDMQRLGQSIADDQPAQMGRRRSIAGDHGWPPVRPPGMATFRSSARAMSGAGQPAGRGLQAA